MSYKIFSNTKDMSKKVLVVDDSLYMRTLIKDALAGAGYEIIGMAANGESAIDMAFELQPDIITLDNILPDMLGIDILKVLKEEEVPFQGGDDQRRGPAVGGGRRP
jgi:two-component system chemotaxis response regulator CheY